jgi:hypothetical protein
MFDFIADSIAGLTWRSVLIGTAIFLVTFSLSLGIVSLILVKIPADYFRNNHHSKFWVDRQPAVRIVALVGKNILGVLLIMVGIIVDDFVRRHARRLSRQAAPGTKVVAQTGDQKLDQPAAGAL